MNARNRKNERLNARLYNLTSNCVIDFRDFGTLVNYGLSTLQKVLFFVPFVVTLLCVVQFASGWIII